MTNGFHQDGGASTPLKNPKREVKTKAEAPKQQTSSDKKQKNK